MLKITQVVYMNNYTVKIKFNNGEYRIFDFGPVISKYPVFRSLSDLNLFRDYTLTDTLEWNNGEIDIAPEYLYEHGVVA